MLSGADWRQVSWAMAGHGYEGHENHQSTSIIHHAHCLLAEKNNEPLAVSSVRGGFFLSGFLSLRPGIPSKFSRRIPTADANSNLPFDLDLRPHVPATTPSQGVTRMHARPMHVLGFAKGGGDTYDG